MTLTIMSTDSVTVGTNTAISTAGDDFYLLSGVLLGSTTGNGISVSAADVNLRIDGLITAQNLAILSVSANTTVTIGSTGVVASFQSSSGTGGFNLQGGSSDVINYGEISAPESMALFLRNSNNEVFNAGSISGTSGVVFYFGGSDDRLINYGEIVATGSFDGLQDDFEGVGVLMTSSQGFISNGAGGQIVSTALDGKGIAAGIDATGLQIENQGDIAAVRGIGVDFSPISGSSGGNLINSGSISGLLTAVRGSDGIDVVRNSGSIHGDVVLNGGDDIFISSGAGQLYRGAVYGGDGNDSFSGGASDDSFLGEAGNDTMNGRGGDDILDGGDGNDEIRGGADDDLLLGGGGKDSLYGGDGDDVLDGGNSHDYMRGGQGDDMLFGGGGIDTLNGGRGNDVLNGGGGVDTFEFFRNAGDDVITDFVDGVDLIDLTAFGLRPSDYAAFVAPALFNAGGGATMLDLTHLGGQGSVLIEGLAFASADASDFVL